MFSDAVGGVRKAIEERDMYDNAQATMAMATAIRLCAENKEDSESDTLLIEAPLFWLSKIRWLEIQPRIFDLLREFPFENVVHVSWSANDNGDLVMQLK